MNNYSSADCESVRSTPAALTRTTWLEVVVADLSISPIPPSSKNALADGTAQRRCSSCLTERPAEDFRRRDGARCRLCRYKAARERRHLKYGCPAISSRALAKAAGNLTYSTGAPCPNGHSADRYVSSGRCVECALKQCRDRVKSGYFKERYRKDPGARNAVTQIWREANRERCRESTRAWIKRNPEKHRAHSTSRNHRRRAAGGMSSADLALWTKKQKKVCYWCGRACAKKFHIDHYKAISRGGKHEAGNLVISCAPCNLSKGAKDPYVFAQSVGMLF